MAKADDSKKAGGARRAALPQRRPGLLARLFGPPIEALQRAWRALIDSQTGWLGRVLEFWRFLFLGPEPDEEGAVSPPAKTAWLLASAVVALTLYSWPLSDILPVWLFVVLAVVVWIFALRSIQFASVRGSGHRWEAWLRASERRAGLVWWERLGLLLAAGATAAAVMLRPSLLPLTISSLLGFFVLLGQPPGAREPRTIRPLPAPLPDDAREPTAADGYVARHFSWTTKCAYGADTHDLSLHLHEQTYADQKASNPGTRWDGDTPQFAPYIVDGTTPDIDRAALALHGLVRERRYSTYEEVSLALSFVQAIRYSLDIDSVGQHDYWRYPIETLYDETGDCEDTTILAAALLRRLGHSVVALHLPEHAALGVEAPAGTPGRFIEHGGKSMYYCETTATGWEVGELPNDYDDAEVRILPVPDLPGLRR